MKKILIAVIGVVVLGYLASPVIIGLVAKERFPALVKANSVGDRIWTADDFHLGYLHSTADSTLTIPMHNARPPVVVHMHHRIFQRLAPDMSIMEITSTPTFEGGLKHAVATFFGDKPPLVIHTVVFMDGHYRATFDSPTVPATAVPGAPGLRVRFDGMHGTETGTFHPVAAKSTLVAPGLEVDDARKGVNLKVSGVRLSADLRQLNRWLQLGTVQLSTDDVTVTQAATMATTDLTGLKINVDSRRESDGLGGEYDIHVAGFDAPQASFKNLAMEMAMHRIDEKSVKALAKRLAELGRLAVNRQEASEMYARAVRRAAPALLMHSPEFQLKQLAFDLPDGHVQLRADVKFDGKGFSGPLTRDALNRMTLDADATVAKAAFEHALRLSLRAKAAAYIKATQPDLAPPDAAAAARQMAAKMAQSTEQNLVNRGLLAESGSDFTSRLAVREGKLSINGQPMGAALAQHAP